MLVQQNLDKRDDCQDMLMLVQQNLDKQDDCQDMLMIKKEENSSDSNRKSTSCMYILYTSTVVV